MKKLGIGVVLLALAGCASTAEVRPVSTLSGTLRAERHDDLRGAARVNTGMFETAATVSIAGARSGATHPWHIHAGTCGSGGAIVGPANAYPALRVGNDGTASATGRIDLGLDPAASYYVNIHASPSDLGTIIGCLPLSR